jgi:hypothetical protein
VIVEGVDVGGFENSGGHGQLLASLIICFYMDKRLLGRVSVCFFGVFGNFIWIKPIVIRLAKSVFGSVIAVVFQIAFRAEIHANDVFLFFKNHF